MNHDMSALSALIRPDDGNCFESAIIASADPLIRSISDVKDRILASDEQDPFIIAVPSEMSGSFYSAQNIINKVVLDHDPSLQSKVRFVHLSASDRMSALKGGNDYIAPAHIQMSVQFPGTVDGEVRSTMARIIADDELHFVGMSSEEFAADFSDTAQYGYHLRSVPLPSIREGVPAQLVSMLSMGVVVAARDPQTITDYELRQSTNNRNNSFIAQFRANPGLFDFDPQGLTHFPIIARPGNYQREASLTISPSRQYNRRAIFGAPPVIDFT